LTATDAAGNESQPSAPVNITVDTTAPDAPDAPAQADDDVGPDTGAISQNGVTDDSRPEFSGTAPLGAQTVRVYDNGVLLGTTTVDPQTRAWSFTPETPLADGAHIIRVAPVDAAGNIGAPGPDLNFEVRGDIPGVPAITGVSDNVEGITGAIQKDQRTNDATPTVSGTGVPASTMVVSVDGTVAGSTTVDANGRWSFTPSTALAEGAHTFTAVAQMGGLTSAATGDFPFVVDISAPNAPAAVVITDDQGAQTGTVTGGQSTDDATPTFSGSGATPGDVITVLDNGVPVASAVVQADGSWSVTPTQPLRDGPHSITLTATDAAGNESQPSTPVAITVNTSAAGVQVYHAIDDAGSVTGEVADGGRTNDTPPPLVGRAEAGAVVTITEGGTTLGSAVADLGGRWQVSLPNQSATGHTYTATAVGAAGT
jgi:hypothetical protein